MTYRVLHVDDEPDIREVVQIALSLDPGLVVRSCQSGQDAIAEAAVWKPDLILCDVMMPAMDGPATLARLRECRATSEIPVVFMTARAQAAELDRFKSLGAVGTIAKPFDPMTLAELVRQQIALSKVGRMMDGFEERLRADRLTLALCYNQLANNMNASVIVGKLQTCAHKLAGAAAIFGYQTVSDAAAKLEEQIIVSDRRTLASIEPGSPHSPTRLTG